MQNQIDPRYLFWFCCAVVAMGFTAMMCLIYLPYPNENRDMAFGTMGFIQGSLIVSALGFLLTGSVNLGNRSTQPPAPGHVDLTLSANTNEPKAELKLKAEEGDKNVE